MTDGAGTSDVQTESQDAEPILQLKELKDKDNNPVGPRTHQTDLKATVTVSPAKEGTLRILAGKSGTEPVETRKVTKAQSRISVDHLDLKQYANSGVQQLIAEWTPVGDPPQTILSKPVFLTIDTEGPMLESLDLVGIPGGGSTLIVRFRKGDLDPVTVQQKKNFLITRSEGTDSFSKDVPYTATPVAEGNVVKIFLGQLISDTYRLLIPGSKPTSNEADTPLRDLAGNYAGGTGTAGKDQQLLFTSYPGRVTGPHVEFPPFAPPKTGHFPEGFNPGDKVETRVARLYYYRDAHRVAQIINRNVKSYNRAAVDQKRREAEGSRKRADDVTDERRAKERAAVNAAQETRRAEHELRELPQKIAAAREQSEKKRIQHEDALKAQARLKEKQGQANLAKTNSQTEWQNLANQVLTKRGELPQLTTTRDNKSSQRSAKRRSLSDAESGAKSDQQSREQAFEALQEAEKQLADAKKELARLQAIQAKLNASSTATPEDKNAARIAAETQSNAVSRLQDTRDRKSRELVAAEDRLTSANALVLTARDALATAENELTTAEQNVLNAQSEIKGLQEQAEVADQKRRKAAQEAAAAEEELAKDTQRTTDTNTAFESAKAEVNKLETSQSNLNNEITRLRQDEIKGREEMDTAQAVEDRAREDQFRKEVAAAHEDPDTYAPGKIHSVDPVTQVSISVIGEGLIQLRGPIKGINKIRTMINQIDSPVGQVKVGIFTVQVNGEHENRMEKVVQRIEGNIDVSRFLTSQSCMLLRKAVQQIASDVAVMAESDAIAHQGMYGNAQIDRDRKYLYAFFGRDFVDELYAMNSEFLQSGNKVLSIHSMDTVSLSRALFVLALAKNEIRQAILARFMQLVETELPAAEYDFRKAGHTLPCFCPQKKIFIHACEIYRFRSLRGFFDAEVQGTDTMTPMQREFIRLAQIFKSQMVAEVELNQRVIERGLIEDQANDEAALAKVMKTIHDQALQLLQTSYQQRLAASTDLAQGLNDVQATAQSIQTALNDVGRILQMFPELKNMNNELVDIALNANLLAKDPANKGKTRKFSLRSSSTIYTINVVDQENWSFHSSTMDSLKRPIIALQQKFRAVPQLRAPATLTRNLKDFSTLAEIGDSGVLSAAADVINGFDSSLKKAQLSLTRVASSLAHYLRVVKNPVCRQKDVEDAYRSLIEALDSATPEVDLKELKASVGTANAKILSGLQANEAVNQAKTQVTETRQALNHRKLLDFLIDQHEDKYIELVEGTRASIAAVDNYLKRLAIALEDDFKVQFYDPAFREIRHASTAWDVNLGQVERTTILTNNRAFAKVAPQATMEFDLPKRDILIQEAMKGAKAMVEDYGALMQDPVFLSATKLLSGSSPASLSIPPRPSIPGLPSQGQLAPSVRNVLPGLPSSTEENVLNQSGGPKRELGAAMEALIPDPAIYKFETGTGFEIRPVIQPDGDSIIYDFNYMYTTNVREPVRADEKHLGRVKRHFIDTQVQTSSFELREISRYQVTLKASRTSRGVPLFEDIPGVGILFRPLPSAESSLQQNIILGQSTVYPTLFDLMGLRWAPQIVDLADQTLVNQEHIARGRRSTIEHFVFDEASKRVDQFLGIPDKARDLVRPDLYRPQTQPSPYHPNGYNGKQLEDPTGNDFIIPDQRPPGYRLPEYDQYRRPVLPPYQLPGAEEYAPDTYAPSWRGPAFGDSYPSVAIPEFGHIEGSLPNAPIILHQPRKVSGPRKPGSQ